MAGVVGPFRSNPSIEYEEYGVATRYMENKHRQLLSRLRNDEVATQTAIIRFHQRKLSQKDLTREQRQRHHELLAMAHIRLSRAEGQ